MPATAGLSKANVARWLSASGIAVAAPVTIARLGHGESNLTFLVTDTSGHRWVLRRPPMTATLATAHDVLREAHILARLAASPVPVPRVIATAEPGAQADVAVVLLEFVDGVVLDRPAAAAALSPAALRKCGLALPRALARIHAVELAEAGLSDLASHAPYGPRQLRRWSRQWEQSRTIEVDGMDALRDRLTRAVPDGGRTTLVHGDLHVRNVIVSPADGAIRAVLDWELATLGAPLSDLGTMLAYWVRPDLTTLDEPVFGGRVQLASADELIDAYCAASGRDVDSAELTFWLALAFWKIAIIVQGVALRVAASSGPGSERQARAFAMVGELVAHAHEVATVGGL